MSEVRIDDMKESDLPEVQALSEQLGYPSSLDDLARRFKNLISSSSHHLFVARSQNRVVGWVHVGVEMSSLLADERADIGALIVDSNFRSKGIGRMLMDAAESWAVSIDLSLVRVRSNIKREDAHRFYQRQGYEKIKSWHLFTKKMMENR